MDGDWLEMPRIDAGPVATKMVDLEPIRDRPPELFIDPAMGIPILVDAAVPVRGDVSRPDPALA